MSDISIGREVTLDNRINSDSSPSEQGDEATSVSSIERMNIEKIEQAFETLINSHIGGAFLNLTDRAELFFEEDIATTSSEESSRATSVDALTGIPAAEKATSTEASSRTASVDALSQIPLAERATSQESIDFYCNSYLAAAKKLVSNYDISLPEETGTEPAAAPSPERPLSADEAKEAIAIRISQIDDAVRTALQLKLETYPQLKAVYKKDFYGTITPLKKTKVFQAALNQVRNEAECPVIKKTIPGSTNSSPTYQSTITPASNLPIVADYYKAEGIKSVASSDTQNPYCSVNHARDELLDISGKRVLCLNRSGVSTSNYETMEAAIVESASTSDSDVNLDLEERPAMSLDERPDYFEIANSSVHLATEYCNQNPTSNPSQVEVQLRRMLQNIIVGLDGKQMLASASVDKDHPTHYHMLSCGLLSHFKPDESTMSDLNFQLIDFLNTQTIAFPLSELNSDGTQKTVYIKPAILALDFGVEQTTKFGVSFTEHGSSWLPGMQASLLCQETNKATLDHLLGDTGFVADILAGNNSKIFNGKVLLDEDQVVSKALWQECSALRAAGRSLTDTSDYGLIARVIVLCDRLGIDPHIFCKSGKDRTSRAIEEAKALAITIENNLKNRKDPLFGTHPPHAGATEEERTACFNYLVTVINVALHAGNSEVQQRNTGVRGNKQFLAFEARLSPPYVDAQMKRRLENQFQCTIKEIVKEYAGLSKLAKT